MRRGSQTTGTNLQLPTNLDLNLSLSMLQANKQRRLSAENVKVELIHVDGTATQFPAAKCMRSSMITKGAQGSIHAGRLSIVDNDGSTVQDSHIVLKSTSRDGISKSESACAIHMEITLDHKSSLDYCIVKLIDIVKNARGDVYSMLPFLPIFLPKLIDPLLSLKNCDPVLYEVIVAKIMMDTLTGLKHMHASGFVHRDIKPANIGYHPQGRWCLADLDSSTRTDAKQEDLEHDLEENGTPYFTHPKVFVEVSHSTSVSNDIYAMGQVYLALLRGGPSEYYYSRDFHKEQKELYELTSICDRILKKAPVSFFQLMSQQQTIQEKFAIIAARMTKTLPGKQPNIDEVLSCVTNIVSSFEHIPDLKERAECFLREQYGEVEHFKSLEESSRRSSSSGRHTLSSDRSSLSIESLDFYPAFGFFGQDRRDSREQFSVSDNMQASTSVLSEDMSNMNRSFFSAQ